MWERLSEKILFEFLTYGYPCSFFFSFVILFFYNDNIKELKVSNKISRKEFMKLY